MTDPAAEGSRASQLPRRRAARRPTSSETVDADVTLIGNVALRNRAFGFVSVEPGRLIGNRAEQNGAGFRTEQVSDITGKIAQNNVGAGFVVEPATRLDLVHDNVARGNGGDGFQVIVPRDRVGTLSSNYAINNLGHGLHVVDGFGQGLLVEPTATIIGITAFGNGAAISPTTPTAGSRCGWPIASAPLPSPASTRPQPGDGHWVFGRVVVLCCVRRVGSRSAEYHAAGFNRAGTRGGPCR